MAIFFEMCCHWISFIATSNVAPVFADSSTKSSVSLAYIGKPTGALDKINYKGSGAGNGTSYSHLFSVMWMCKMFASGGITTLCTV